MSHVPRIQPCRPGDAGPSTGDAVYVTFGTLFNHAEGALHTAAMAASDVAEEVVVTLGRGRDPSELGPVPDHVRVEGFVAQADVLPRCAAVPGETARSLEALVSP